MKSFKIVYKLSENSKTISQITTETLQNHKKSSFLPGPCLSLLFKWPGTVCVTLGQFALHYLRLAWYALPILLRRPYTNLGNHQKKYTKRYNWYTVSKIYQSSAMVGSRHKVRSSRYYALSRGHPQMPAAAEHDGHLEGAQYSSNRVRDIVGREFFQFQWRGYI